MDRLPDGTERFRNGLLSWVETHRREYPWRESDRSLYDVFVAEFLLTQTPANNVANVYPEFLARFPSLSAIDDADPDEIERLIEPLGFQRMRTEALTVIAAEYDRLPSERDTLLDLQRVGPYVADATLCFACDRRLPIVDRNVVRVYDRVFRAAFPENDRERRAFARNMLPESDHDVRRYNLGLLDFGALVCQKQTPKCEECFASSECAYYARS